MGPQTLGAQAVAGESSKGDRTVNMQEAVAQHFRLMYQTAAANLNGLTHDQSLMQPSPGGNCANWILGHLMNVHNGVMSLVGEKPVWESSQLAQAGDNPITGPTNAIDWNTMRERFLGSKDRCLAAISALPDRAPRPETTRSSPRWTLR